MLGNFVGWLLIVAVLWAIGWALFATISIGVAKLAGRRGVEPRWTALAAVISVVGLLVWISLDDGPVPTWLPGVGGTDSQVVGVLVHEKGCLYLEADGVKHLVYLPAPAARWDASSRTVTFVFGDEAMVGEEVTWAGHISSTSPSPQLRSHDPRCEVGSFVVVRGQ